MDFRPNALEPAPGSSYCEFKGVAAYLTVVGGDRREEGAAWYYPWPAPEYDVPASHGALYLGRMDACFVDGERVRPQDGGFYGGWIPSRVVGPFKGGPGSAGW